MIIISMKMRAISSVLMLLSVGACQAPDLVLVDQGSTPYTIELSKDPDSLEIRAANELQKYLKEMAGVIFPLKQADVQAGQPGIVIGNTKKSYGLNPAQDEILIKVRGDDLFILGGDPRATLYAVYSFLEDFLGCRFYAPDAEFIPKTSILAIPAKTDYRYIPPVTTRTVHSRLYYEDPEFADKRKTTHEAFPGYVPSARVHTFHRFVPADIYYDSHPEYYALRSGQRLPTQLCLTNKDVLKLVIGAVDSLLEAHPEASVISVSQDDNQQYCECSECMMINDREGTAAGSVIDFVNKVAAEFPDKMISTLAYQYTRKAPSHLKPRENVLITLCSIECDRSGPIGEKCQDFTHDLEAWGTITDNIRIWDYTTQFTNFLAPFPNLYTLQPNIQLFLDNNARWIFEQHSHQPSELFELRSYITAKLLWDPFINQDSVILDFLKGYYEEAAPFIWNYIAEVHKELQNDDEFFLFLYGDPSQAFSSFLRPELLKQYDQWYNEAEKAVRTKPEIRKRVDRARLSVDYAILEAARFNDPASFALVAVRADGMKLIPESLKLRLQRFRSTCLESGITMMNEMRYTVEEYLNFYDYTLSRAMQENKATDRQVQLNQKPAKYANEDPQTLTDGVFGGTSFFANWLGFEGNDLEAVIDLGRSTDISFLSCDFLQVVNHVVFFPVEVRYYVSSDGKSFRLLGKVQNKWPLTRQSKVNDVQSFTLECMPVSTRYIKIFADNMGPAPVWHFGAGMPSWIFADEVIVR